MTNNPFKLAAIDLDGTLLGPDHSVSRENALAINRMQEAGIRCILASGRMHQATVRFAKELNLDGPVLSYHGAMIRWSGEAEPWHHERVPADAAMAIVDFCRERGHHLNYYLNDHLYVAEKSDWAEFYLKQTGSPMEVVGNLEQFEGSEPTKLLLIDNPEVTANLQDQFREQFGRQLYITITNPEYLEFMNPHANKGAALALVAKHYGIRQEETVAFGDAANDIPMLKWAGMGIAMGQANEAVQISANLAAPRYDQGGFVEAVKMVLAASGPN